MLFHTHKLSRITTRINKFDDLSSKRARAFFGREQLFAMRL